MSQNRSTAVMQSNVLTRGETLVMDSKKFRAQLAKIMPGYDWTVHRSSKGATKIVATGTQSSGFNRLSTLEVSWSNGPNGQWFSVRSSGFGLRSPWLGENGDITLARALRGLQDYYLQKAENYGGHARALANGRLAADGTEAAA